MKYVGGPLHGMEMTDTDKALAQVPGVVVIVQLNMGDYFMLCSYIKSMWFVNVDKPLIPYYLWEGLGSEEEHHILAKAVLL